MSSDSDQSKPVKVKSRWRRSSELEMTNSPSISKSNSPVVSPENSNQSDQISLPPVCILNEKLVIDKEVERRLKQFLHLRENLYLTERISCKEAKKMTCDCFLTSEEMEKGDYGCGEDCLNRLLMIEWLVLKFCLVFVCCLPQKFFLDKIVFYRISFFNNNFSKLVVNNSFSGNSCAVGERCTNKRFQKGQFAPCEVFRTDKKGLGLRAAANIP